MGWGWLSTGAEWSPQARGPWGTEGLHVHRPSGGTHSGLRGGAQALIGGGLQGHEGPGLPGMQRGCRLHGVFPGAVAQLLVEKGEGSDLGALGDQGGH